MILSLREWLVTLVLFAVVTGIIYYGWDSWEHYAPGPDHRETCWAELQSDYWAYMRWCRYAKEHYDIMLIGDSVIWGQEVRNDETISHYINEFLGEDKVANLGNDGLFMAGMNGFVKYYGDHMENTNVILQCSPLWMASKRRDLRGDKTYRYHHPRLIPQFSSRIEYYHDLNTRLGYLMEYYFRVFPFMRHLMANYFENKSVSRWMMDHPYMSPFSAITFEAAPVMAEIQGRGLDWETKGIKMSEDPFVSPDESIQFECFMNAVKELKKKNAKVFILIGPYNHHYHVPESRKRLFALIDELKSIFDELGYPYYDTFQIGLPSKTFGDSCHLLKEGHSMLAKELVKDESFQKWLTELNE